MLNLKQKCVLNLSFPDDFQWTTADIKGRGHFKGKLVSKGISLPVNRGIKPSRADVCCSTYESCIPPGEGGISDTCGRFVPQERAEKEWDPLSHRHIRQRLVPMEQISYQRATTYPADRGGSRENKSQVTPNVQTRRVDRAMFAFARVSR